MSAIFTFTGAEVLVTGGTSGIGNGVARAFRDSGANVTITGTRERADDYDVDIAGMTYRSLDLRNREAIDSLADSISSLDVLVNNAGANRGDESTPTGFEAAIELNLLSVHRLTTQLRDALKAGSFGGDSSVINVASMSAYRPVVYVPGYGAAKAAVVHLTKQLGLMWAEDGIRVNAVAPGLIRTGMTEIMVGVPELEDGELAKVPMARWGHPDDLAPMFLFLASTESRFITGQTFNVDGGYSLT